MARVANEERLRIVLPHHRPTPFTPTFTVVICCIAVRLFQSLTLGMSPSSFLQATQSIHHLARWMTRQRSRHSVAVRVLTLVAPDPPRVDRPVPCFRSVRRFGIRGRGIERQGYSGWYEQDTMGKDGGSKPPASQRTAKDGESTSSSARSAPTPSSASSLKAHSGKSLRPLSSFLGVSLGGVSQKQHRDHSTSKKSSSSKSTSNAFVDEDGFRIPAPERQKTSSSSSSSSKTASRSFQRANTSGHTIELSSDEDDNVVVGDDDVQLVEIDDDDDEIPARADSDDEELVLTGFKQGPPSASTSQPAAPKLVTSAKRKGDQQAASPSPSKETAKGRGAHESAKALGKQKAKEEERNYVELEVMDHRTGESATFVQLQPMWRHAVSFRSGSNDCCPSTQALFGQRSTHPWIWIHSVSIRERLSP